MACAEYELVARVGKARGLEGEVTATTAGNLPFSVYAGLHVHVVPPTLQGPRELDVSSVCEGAGNTYQLHFEGIDTIDAAEQIAGRFLLADTRDLEGIDMPLREIGRMVVDERHGEVLVPVVDEVIVSYPEDENEPICTRVMDGLLES